MSTDNAKVLSDYIAEMELDSATQVGLDIHLQPIIYLEHLASRTSLPHDTHVVISHSVDYIAEFCQYMWNRKIGWENTMGVLDRLDPIIDVLHTEGKTATKPAKQITLEDIMSELGVA